MDKNLEKLSSMKEARRRRPHTIPYHFHKMSRIGNSMETESKLVVAEEMWGREGVYNMMEEGSERIRSLYGDENVLKLAIRMIVLPVNTLKAIQLFP